jgi:hypothetical protein
MTATGTKPSRRYSREQQQEDRSEGQLKDRFAELGWPCDRLGRDLGEDLNVRIYDDGASTGLSFLVQLKSSADAERFKRKKSPALGYRLEVKDLLHWKVSTTLVVLVVWDVEKRAGWWRPIPEIVKELDETNKGWRKKKTVAVSVPLANGTDKAGLTKLRWQIADHNLPIVPKPRRTKFSLVFDKTDEGIAAFRDFKRAVEMDERLILEGKFAPKIKYPEWYRRLYGHAPVIQLNKFEKGRSLLSKETIALRIDVDSSEGHAEYPYVELRPVVQGRKRLVLTNEHQSLPLVFRFEFDLYEENLAFSFKKERSGRTVYEARDAAMFLVAAATPGAMIRVTTHRNGQFLPSFPAPRSSTDHDLQSMRRWRDILDKLCHIQQRIADVGVFQLEDILKFSPAEVSRIDSLFEICRSGRIETTMSISFEIPPGMDGPSVFTVIHRGRSVRLLNLSIPLGDMRVTVLDSAHAANAVRAAKSEANATGKPAMVTLENLRIVQEYPAWLPGKLPWVAMYEALERLAEVTNQNDGYLTRADTRAAGATDAVFDALVSEHKIEQVAPNVFRLTHFPRSDHEDLIALWLQTDRQGVISHDTALLLHELSDILPRRRHITVPPGWDPGDRKLDANVVLHHAEVGPDEIRWLGPVPYTAPLRTLRDCIASHVSPDLIEQAIADGLARGMFTEAELPPETRRGAA